MYTVQESGTIGTGFKPALYRADSKQVLIVPDSELQETSFSQWWGRKHSQLEVEYDQPSLHPL